MVLYQLDIVNNQSALPARTIEEDGSLIVEVSIDTENELDLRLRQKNRKLT
jgi:hypothetical protein